MASRPNPESEPSGYERVAALSAEVDGPLVCAVSGGGDSVALLAILRRAAPERKLFALVVDHGLRAGSDRAAAAAAGITKGLGGEARTRRLEWANALPTGQAGARRARYRALADALHDLGARALFVGHTGDDQLETARIRTSAASGAYGQAGMAEWSPFPLWPEGRGLALVRPLLGVRRRALRLWLADAGIAFLDDPANDDPRFERVRVRTSVGALDDAGFVAELAVLAERQDRARDLDAQAAVALAEARIGLDGDVNVPAEAIEGLSTPVRRRALAALVAAGSGNCDPPPGAGLDRLAAWGWPDATLGGAAFRKVGGDVLHVRRDPGAALGRGRRPGPRRLDFEAPLIVDGRLALTPLAEELSLELRPSAKAGIKALVISPEGEWPLAQAAQAGLVTVEPLAGEIIRRVLWRNVLWRCDALAPVLRVQTGQT